MARKTVVPLGRLLDLDSVLCSYFAWYVAALSYDGWPSPNTTRSVAVLIPGALHALFGVEAAVYVERVF